MQPQPKGRLIIHEFVQELQRPVAGIFDQSISPIFDFSSINSRISNKECSHTLVSKVLELGGFHVTDVVPFGVKSVLKSTVNAYHISLNIF